MSGIDVWARPQHPTVFPTRGMIGRLIAVALLFALVDAYVPPNEVNALQALYDTTNGDSWFEECRQGWNFTGVDVDPCRDAWYGITCTSNDCANSTCSIERLSLGPCNMQGSLPNELSELTSLVRISFPSNYLHGTLPSIFSLFTGLYYLQLRHNSFTGTIPAEYSILRAMNRIDVFDNSLTGTLPYQYSVLTKLSIFFASSNMLSGTIPMDFLNGPNTRYVEMQNNNLWGAFPRIGADIRTLDIMNNDMTGTISSYVFDRSMLGTLTLDNNYLTGTLPNINYRTRLTALHLRNNFLSGSLPPSLANYSRGAVYGFSRNMFCGVLPNILNEFSYLYDVSYNRLSGTLPSITQATALAYLYAHRNMLSGSLPEQLNKASHLVHLMVFDNRMTGTIPSSLGRLTRLNTLLLHGNRFHGSMENLLLPANSSAPQQFPSLKILDISDNAFGGTVPIEVFTLPNIIYASVGENCYEGPLPMSICDATQLEVLIAEGLSSGRKCRNGMWDPFGLTNAYFVDATHDKLPECIYRMPRLTVFHASGNGLTGTIPHSVNSSMLRDLKLSDNLLNGDVPAWLQHLSVESMDISRNRFGGTFSLPHDKESMTAVTSMSISGNRFSGEISRGFKLLRKADVLLGNLFSCESRDDLPDCDPDRKAYVCGSDAYDIPLIMWSICIGGIVGFAVIAIATLHLSYHQADSVIFRVKSYLVTLFGSVKGALNEWTFDVATISKKYPHLSNFIVTLRCLRRLVLILTASVVVGFGLVYLCFKTWGNNSTHQYQYRWIISAAYLTGVAPAILMMILLIAVLYYLVHVVYSVDKLLLNDESTEVDESVKISNAASSGSYTTLQSYALVASIVLLNGVVIMIVKGTYVYLLIWQDLSYQSQILLNVTLSVFDILWNSVVVTNAMSLYPSLIRSKIRVRIHLLLLLFNSIVAPMLSVACTDRNCFSELFVGRDAITSEETFVICADTVAERCIFFDSLVLTSSFIPPYKYGYQCMSSLMTKFVPVFIFSHIMLGFILPLCLAIIIFKYDDVTSVHLPLPRLLFPRSKVSKNYKLMKPGIILSILMNHLTVLLTFGVAAPPLAVCIAWSICIMSYSWELLIGRYLHITQQINADEDTAVAPYDRLNQICHDVSRSPVKAVWVISDYAYLFFMCLSMDIVGDQYGWVSSVYYTVLPTVCASLLCRVVYRTYVFQYAISQLKHIGFGADAGVELPIIQVQSPFTPQCRSSEVF